MRPVAETIQMPPSRERRRDRITRERRVDAARAAARRQLQGGADGGRAWINGTEVGGPDIRFAHLDRSYD
jgi:hypothetical protein